MPTFRNAIGVDVSKLTLDVQDYLHEKYVQVVNAKTGFKELLKWVKLHNSKMEDGIATVYWRDFSGSHSFLFRIRLVLLGTSVSQCTMPSFSVVPAFDIFKNSQSGLLLS